MVWVLVFTVLIGGVKNNVAVEPFSTLRACEEAAERVMMIPKADPATCTLKDQRPA